ncbi:hypothetical protein Tco_0260622 [Tanacetum coccineum]
MSLSLAENVIVAGADNHPPMIDKTRYSSWASRMLLYIKLKENKKLLVDLVLNGPFKYRTVTEPKTATTPATVRDRRYDELTDAEKIRNYLRLKSYDETVLGRQTQGYTCSSARSNAIATRVNKNGGTNTISQAKVIRCFNVKRKATWQNNVPNLKGLGIQNGLKRRRCLLRL